MRGEGTKIMLVTRPQPDCDGTMYQLQTLGIEAIATPLLARQTLLTPLPPAEQFAGMAVSSSNALRALLERNQLAPYHHLPVFAVGEHTALVAGGMGCTKVFSAGGDFADLVKLIGRAKLAGPLFYPAGAHRSADLGAALKPMGIEVVMTPVYAMAEIGELPHDVIDKIGAGEIDAGLFFSRRTAQSFVKALSGRLNARQRQGFSCLCISKAAAEPVEAAGYQLGGISAHPDAVTMISLALGFAQARNAQ